MRTILCYYLIFISTILFAQEQRVTENIIDFKTIERNKKHVIFSEIKTNINTSFIITANNNKSKDFNRCKWESLLSYNGMKDFIEQLTMVDTNKERKIEYDNFVIRVKRNKVRIVFNNSKCLQEHKTHYFQESCNRAFSFVLTNHQKEQLTANMNGVLHYNKHVRK